MNRHRAVIVRPGEVDRHGDPVAGPEGTTRRTPVEGVVLAPRGSTEVQNYSDTVLTDLTAFWPAGAPLPRATDLVEVDGATFSVEGTPSTWSSPFRDWTPGAQVALTRREG